MSVLRVAAVGVVCLFAAGCGCGGGPLPTLPEKLVGHCVYTNPFSNREECRDYLGEWTVEQATRDCKDQRSTIQLDTGCSYEARLGYCVLTNGDGRFTRITMPGDDASKCGPSERGCELFGGGTFDPSPVCGGVVDDVGGTGLPTFQQPALNCVAPKAGEPPGRSDGGLVCTWEMISGATEEGRSYPDYASCDRVRTQRPYYAAPGAPSTGEADPRMDEPAYRAEQGWVKQQIEATACVCCHSTRAPRGTSNWYLEAPGNFLSSFYPRGLAMGAGWINTVGFGAYPKEHNNGFSRATPDRPSDSIFVTTDPARMARFFEGELARRGYTRADFASQTYGAGPLDDQRLYQPAACSNGEGVQADGTVTWRGGGARYVYVLEADATSPTVPPNLDLPAGTVWRLDVPAEGTPLPMSSVAYGVVPAGTSQRFPAGGAVPTPLVSGRWYYLYVLADVAIPVTRCLFTAP